MSALLLLVAAGTLPIARAHAQTASAQSATPSKPETSAQAPAPQKSTAEDNPFPVDVSEKAAEQKQKEQQAAPPDAPDTGLPAAAAQPGSNASDSNAFPEDVSRRAAVAKDADGSGVSSSSSSSANPDAVDADAAADLPRDTGRRRLRKPSREDLQSGSLAGEGVAKDDTRVGNFYLGDRNYQGAYNRFAEAVRLDPGDLDAIYGLAEAAAGLHRTEEAANNYKLYLAVAPAGGHAKAAERALRDLAK